MSVEMQIKITLSISESTPALEPPAAAPPAHPLPSPLPHIPTEVLRFISQFVDRHSAVSLTRTAKSLRDAGEMALWRNVDISSGWTPSKGKDFQLGYTNLLQVCSNIVTRNAYRTSLGIKQYPFRQSAITGLRVEPTGGADDDALLQWLANLVHALGPQLKRLDIVPIPTLRSSRGKRLDHLSQEHFFQVLNFSPRASVFGNLVHVKYAIPARAHIPLDRWLMRMPNLEVLELCSAERKFPSNKGFLYWPDQKPFLRLREIRFDHLYHAYGVGNMSGILLKTLLDLAPNLETLWLRGVFRPKKDDPIMQVLSGLTRLKTFWATGPSSYHSPRFAQAMQVCVLGRVPLLALQQVVMDVPEGCHEWKELDFGRFVRLPHAPALRSVILLTTPRPTLEEYASQPLGPAIVPVQHIPRRFLQNIGRTPQLTHITLAHLANVHPSVYEPNRPEHAYNVDPSRWVAEGYRGVVIRQYVRDDQEFTHLRILSRVVKVRGQASYVGSGRSWRDSACYRKRTVPREVLKAVYKASGSDIEFVKGGRKLVMSDAAWAVLEEWRDSEDDYSDEEILYNSAEEDDDLVTSDEE